MDGLLEMVGYVVMFRPVHALAVGVFSYHAAAALLLTWPTARRAQSPRDTRAATPVRSRRIAV